MRRFSAALLLSLGVAAPVARGAGSGNDFQTLPPCRVLDTRLAAGPLGGPALQVGAPRNFGLTGACGIPAGAVAVSLNATVTNTTAAGHLVLFAGDIAAPGTSNLSFSPRQTRASASIVGVAPDGTLKAVVGGAGADLILDVNGYFAPTIAPPPTVTLDAVPDQTIPTNTTLSLRLSGHSTDALASLSYRLVSGPAGAAVSPLGVFAYSPIQTHIGPRFVTAEVRDGGGRSAQTTFQVTVVDHNHAPVFGPLPNDLTRVGASYTKTLTATDPDAGDTLTFSLLSGPAGMTLTGATLSWTPGVAQLGNWPVRVKVTDRAGLFAVGQFNVGIQFLIATDDAYTVTLGQTLTVNAPGVLANDLDPLPGPLTSAKLTDPDKGTLSAFASNGGFTYQAPALLPAPPFVPEIKYRSNALLLNGSFVEAPLVLDADGDGQPDIIAASGIPGFGIAVFRGTDGVAIWSRAGFDPPNSDCTMGALTGGSLRHLAAADIDDSGEVAIVFPTSCGRDNQPSGVIGSNQARYAAINARDGSFKWLSPPLGNARDSNGNPHNFAFGTVPAIARLRAGETPSILVGRDGSYFNFAGKPECDQFVPGWPAGVFCQGVFALDGRDGTVRQRMAAPFAGFFAPDHPLVGNGTQPAMAADLDGDGSVEIVFGGAVFNNDGSVRSRNTDVVSNPCCSVSYWTGLGNFDDTPDVEVARVSGGGFTYINSLGVYKADGRLLWSTPLKVVSYMGIPAIADVDGSGHPAIVFSTDSVVCAVDYKGNCKWCHDTGLASNGLYNIGLGSGLQVYDLDGDGVPEVIVPIQGEKLLFLDGKTGNQKLTYDMSPTPPSTGVNDFSGGPVIADIRGTGHAEILTIWLGVARLNVVGSATDDWQPARKVVNQESFHPGSINDDGMLPRTFAGAFGSRATNVFRNQGQIVTPPDPLKREQTSFTYTASDGPLTSAPGTVTLTLLPPNRPPVFVSRPPTRYVAPNFAFTYAAQAVDPDPGDTVTYSVKAATGTSSGIPGVCTIGASSGLLTCTNITNGDQNILIVATDTQGAAAYQTILLHESSGPGIVPNVVGLQKAAAGTAIVAAGFAVGDVTKIDNSAPAGEVVQQTPGGGTSELLGSLVDLLVSNGLAPPPPPGPPPNLGNIRRIVVTPASTLHVAGDNVPYRATSVNNDGTGADITAFVTWSSSLTGVATVNSGGIAHAVAAGTTLITATAGGLSGQASLSVAARANGDSTPPVAIVTQPASGGTVTGLTQVLGTATDASFVRHELSLQASGDPTFTLVGQGTSQVTNGVLGTLDPTLLLNGAYTLRLTVFDANGNTTTADVPFVADGSMKVGNFTLAYTDLTVPLAGMPIQLTRLYDSRDKRNGDFGVGWSLGIKAVRISTSGVQGAAWQVVKQGNVYSLVAGRDHLVSISAPSGKVETFDLRISPSSSPFVPFTTLAATFIPRPGTHGILQSLENVNLLILDPQPGPVTLVDDSTLNTFDPDRFIYTTTEGTQYVVSRTKGVESVRDTNGNQITISPGSISHSSGVGVTFERDGGGRITSITDPKGQTQTYAYTALGDLASHTDSASATTSYFYNAQHGLVRIEDPLGHSGARSDYDDQGRLASLTDPNGNTVTYTHDLPGRQEQAEDALGRITTLNYDDRGNVLARTDALGHTTTFTYDSEDNETSRVNADGRRTSTTYNGALPLLTVVDPGGLNLTTTNTYDSVGDPVSVTDPGGRTIAFTYDGNRNVTQVTLPVVGTITTTPNGQGLPVSRANSLGTTTVSTRDAFGRVTREDVQDAASTLLRRQDFTYDANGNRLTETLTRTISGVPTSLTTSHTYDAAGRVTSTTNPAGGVTTYEYDALGRQIAVVDPLGRRTTYTRDDAGRVVLMRYPDGTTEGTAYDIIGNVVSRTDRAGRTTTTAYDAVNRPVKTTFADGSSTQTLYTPGGLVAATIDARGNRTDYGYDTAGRRTTATLPAVLDGTAGPMRRPVRSSSLDALGATTSVTDPNGRQTTFQYDQASHPIKTTFADGTFTTQAFDALGRRTILTNEEGQSTTFTYDALGRLVAVHGLAGDATYTYDEAGNRLTQTDALGRTTSFRYDALNRLTRRTYPAGEFEQVTYDAVGNAVAVTDANGATTTRTYDSLNRATREDFPDATSARYTYTTDGQRASVTDPLGVTIYSYDALGRLASVLTPGGETIHYTRDASGNLLSLASPAAAVSYGYDALNRLVQMNGPEGLAQSFYDVAGNRVRLVAANGTMADSAYDLRNRPTLLTHRNAGFTLLASFANVFSPAGRRTQVTELDGSQVQYAYDALGRLASETRAGVTPLTITHTYDAVGNRTQTVRNGVPTSFTYDVDDRLLADGTSTYAWDANGNLTSKTTGAFSTLYTWDPQNRLKSISDFSGTTQYAYDADGNRVRTTSPGGTTRFLVDAANNTGLTQVLEEKDAGGALQARYSYGNELVAMGRSGLSSFFHFDAQGSTRALTNAAGAPTDSYTFDALGRTENTTGTTANATLYGGQRFDANSGLYQLRARYYDPRIGRFISRDPAAGRPDFPSTLHRYLYANADPVNFRDPTGLDFTLFGFTIASSLSNSLDVAEAFQKLTAACAAKETLYQVSDFIFYAQVAGQLAVVANAFLSDYFQTDLFNDPGRLKLSRGNNLSFDSTIFDLSRENARPGALKKVALLTTSSGGSGGWKFSMEAAGFDATQSATFDLELPSFKTSGGVAQKIFPQTFGCPAISEIYGEFNIKAYGDYTDRSGISAALEVKLSLLKGSFIGSLPLLSGDASYSKTGFKFQVTLGGIFQSTSGQ